MGFEFLCPESNQSSDVRCCDYRSPRFSPLLLSLADLRPAVEHLTKHQDDPDLRDPLANEASGPRLYNTPV